MALPQMTYDTNCEDNMDDIDELSCRMMKKSKMELDDLEVEERVGKTTHSNALRQGVGAHAFLEFKGIDSRSTNSNNHIHPSYYEDCSGAESHIPIGDEFSEVRWLDNDARFNEELIGLQKKLLDSKRRPFEEICLGLGILRFLHIRLCTPQQTRFFCEAASTLLPRSIHLINEFLDSSRIKGAQTAIPSVI